MKNVVENKNTNEEQMEYCVLCGKKTGVKRSEPIWNRLYYVEGAGQLCKKCFLRIQAEGCDQ